MASPHERRPLLGPVAPIASSACPARVGFLDVRLVLPCLIGVRVPSVTQTIDGVSYVVTQDQAQSLFDSVYDDTLGHWASDNPTWVNPL